MGFIIHCSGGSNPSLWKTWDLPIVLSFGGFPQSIKNHDDHFFQPVFDKRTDTICISSHTDTFLKYETGEYWEICLDSNTENENSLDIMMKTFRGETQAGQFPSGNLVGANNEKLEYQFYSLSEIEKNVLNTTWKKAIIGDRWIWEAVEGKQIDSVHSLHSLGLPYASIFYDDKKVQFLIPRVDLDLNLKDKKYLSISIQSPPSQVLLDSILQLEKSLNQYQEFCKNTGNVKISEVFFSRDTRYSSFVEIFNPSEESICTKSLTLVNTEGFSIVLEFPEGFLPPQGTRLIVPPESRYNGITSQEVTKSKFFSGILSLRDSSGKELDSLDLRNIEFEEGEEVFSYKKNGFRDIPFFGPYSVSGNFFGDPGIEWSNEDFKINIKSCSPLDFAFSEWMGEVQLRASFLELIYQGKEECIVRNLELWNGKSKIKLSNSQKILNPYDLMTIGYIPQSTEGIWIQRDLKSILPEQGILLYSKEYLVIQSILPKNSFYPEPILVPSLQFSYTMGYKNKLIPHPYFDGKRNSKGKKNPSFPENPSVGFGEVFFGPTFDGNRRNFQERFLEFEHSNLDSVLLEVEIGKTIDTHLIPFQKSQGLDILLNSSPKCLVPKEYIKINDSLSSDAPRIYRIIHPETGKVLNIWKVEGLTPPYQSFRIEDGSQKNTAPNYSNISEECKSFVNANPGEKDKFYSPLTIYPDRIQGDDRYFVPDSIELVSSLHSFREKLYLGWNSSNKPVYYPSINIDPFPSLQIVLLSDGKIYEVIPPALPQIRGYYPDQSTSDPGWVYICQVGNNQFSGELEIEDNTSIDKIVPYKVRFPNQELGGSIEKNSMTLKGGECALLVDPDLISIPDETIFPIKPTSLWTVESTKTIGGGLSRSDTLDLYWIRGSDRIWISSMGFKTTPNPIQWSLEANEALFLKSNSTGSMYYHYFKKLMK
jgi:hypothetical protein